MIPVYQLGPERKWDQTLPRDAVYGRLAAGGHQMERVTDLSFRYQLGGVVIAPTGYADDDISLVDLQKRIDDLDWCVVLCVSDETNHSEVLRDLHHPNMRLWLQTPRPEVDFRHDRFLIQFTVGSLPHEQTLKAIDLFGTKVAPIVREEVSRRASAARASGAAPST